MGLPGAVTDQTDNLRMIPIPDEAAYGVDFVAAADQQAKAV